MAIPPRKITATERFIRNLNSLSHFPTWREASLLGAELVDLDLEAQALVTRVHAAEADYRERYEELESNGDVHAAEEYIKSLNARVAELTEYPGRYHLASGETIRIDPHTRQAYREGWWFDDDAVAVVSRHGERFHRGGIHPDAEVDPTAQVHPTARIESGAVVGPHTRVGPYVHVGRGAIVDQRCIVQDGAWVGPGCELWSRTWVGPGATVGANSVIGTRTTVGAGADVLQGSQIEPYSRLGTGTTTSTSNRANSYRGFQLAGAIDHLMRLDRD